MGLKYHIRRLLWKTGYDVWKFTPSFHPLARRKQILASYGIDTLLDVGANAGQYAWQLRHDLGFTGRILSFEPQSKVHDILKARAKGDPAWETYPWAIGESDGPAELILSNNPLASSMRRVLPLFLHLAPGAKPVGKEPVIMKRLDSIFTELGLTSKRIYLKIDTQGFESQVLAGAECSLARIDTVQLEMSLAPLYEGEILFTDMCALMKSKGYELIALEDVFSDSSSGRLLQVDGIFHRF